jgi:hypothetical protein
MQMAAEGAIEVGPEPGSLAVSATYTAIVEGRAAQKVDNNFFLVNVPIGNCETQTFVNKFPRVRPWEGRGERGRRLGRLSLF